MTNINPEETLIYKELKSKFEVQDPELWKEVSENIKQVIESGIDFRPNNISLLFAFSWERTEQGFMYWNDIYKKHDATYD